MVNIKTKVILPILALTGILFWGSEANAKEVNVQNLDQLYTVIQNMDEDMKITLDPDFDSYGNPIFIAHETPYTLEIDMNKVNLLFHASFHIWGGGDFIIDNFLTDFSEEEIRDYYLGVELNSAGDSGNLIFKNAVIKNIDSEQSVPFKVFGGKDNPISIENTLVENVKTMKGSGIYIDSENTNLKISDSTFLNNKAEIGGAAIYAKKGYSNLAITNSKFINNVVDLEESEGAEGSGAIYTEESYDVENHLEIKDSYFDQNKIMNNNENDPHLPNGGAISSSRIQEKDFLKITGTTFTNNEGMGAGAVLLNEANSNSSDALFENNTFFKNVNHAIVGEKKEENTIDYLDGGAITILNNIEVFANQKNEAKLIAKNNTFLKNKVSMKENASLKKDGRGGAIGLVNSSSAHKFYNNLLVSNALENNESNSKKYENVYSTLGNYNEKNNVGFDNGTETSAKESEAYGKYPVSLASNNSKIKAGRKEDSVVVPTIMITPKLMNSKGVVYTGIANMAAAEATSVDQRGFDRPGKADIGAVEISSIVYDSNKGKFTLPELTKYDGKTYYEGKNPEQYAQVGEPDTEYTIIDGMKALKPTRKNFKFLGWSNKKDGSVVYKAGDKLNIKDQQVLYAVWKDERVQLKYFSNGKTSGVVPTQKTINTSTEVTIKTHGKMKRKGYKFSGWSTKPSSKKGEAAYAPGKKLKLVKNTKLYAIWKR